MIEILPTCVPRDAKAVTMCVDSVRSFAPAVHIDIDDGRFASVTTWPYTEPGTFEEPTQLPAFPSEIHLMVEESHAVGLAFARAGAMRIIGHVEGFADKGEVFSALHAWKDAGASEVGLGILFATPFEVIEPYVSECNVVHMMSITTIGTQGIPYEKSAPARIAEFHERFPDTLISVDGGVSEKNIAELMRAGARRFGVGSAVMKSADPAGAYVHIQKLAEAALL